MSTQLENSDTHEVIDVEVIAKDLALNFTNYMLDEMPPHYNLDWLDMYPDEFDLFEELKVDKDVEVEFNFTRLTTLMSMGVLRMRNLFADEVIARNPKVSELHRHDILATLGREIQVARIIMIDNYANRELNKRLAEWARENELVLIYPATISPNSDIIDYILRQGCVAHAHLSEDALMN